MEAGIDQRAEWNAAHDVRRRATAQYPEGTTENTWPASNDPSQVPAGVRCVRWAGRRPSGLAEKLSECVDLEPLVRMSIVRRLPGSGLSRLWWVCRTNW
jgi:hypothetical protein